MSEEQDRISALPDAIIHQILSFLPTKHSIQTSILSKRWIHLWKFTPVIDIPMTSPYKDITQSECTFIHNTLTQHQALKLHKFSLKFSVGYLWDTVPDVQRCIEFAISRQVHCLSVIADLCLTFAEPEEYYVLPHMFYSHDNVPSLQQVFLKGFLFNPSPPTFSPFTSLNTLCLFDCTIDDETLKGLLSICPVLESLTIDRCHRLLYFKASCCQSTSLKHLVFRGMYNHGLNLEIDVSSLSSVKVYGDLTKISLSPLPLVIEATVFQWRYCPYDQESHIRTWLQNLARVKKLGVDSWFSQFLARELKVNNSKGWNIFENLKVFSWFGPLAKECDLIALVAFFARCPSLEKIEIDFRSSYWIEASEQRPACALEHPFIEMENGDEQVTIGSLLNVKKITVHHFFGYKSEIEFIKHLLQKAITLETLSLRLELNPRYYGRRFNSRPKELVEEEIFSLHRASSRVHILFQDN